MYRQKLRYFISLTSRDGAYQLYTENQNAEVKAERERKQLQKQQKEQEAQSWLGNQQETEAIKNDLEEFNFYIPMHRTCNIEAVR